MPRPAVDIVVPFAGTPAALEAVVARLERLALGSEDTVTVADNRPAGARGRAARRGRVRVVPAPGRRSSYHARNVAARAGRAPWLVFLDADVHPAPDLLDRYFAPAPAADVAVLAGGIRDERPADPVAARIADVAPLAEAATLDRRWAYAQTANCAVRRAAFHAVGGFAGDVRSGGDADLCFRLRTAGWRLERRPAATVSHAGRRTLRALVRQKARHGAGGAWLDARWPGSLPAEPLPGLARLAVAEGLRAARLLAAGDRAGARAALAAPAARVATRAGRALVANDAPPA